MRLNANACEVRVAAGSSSVVRSAGNHVGPNIQAGRHEETFRVLAGHRIDVQAEIIDLRTPRRTEADVEALHSQVGEVGRVPFDFFPDQIIGRRCEIGFFGKERVFDDQGVGGEELRSVDVFEVTGGNDVVAHLERGEPEGVPNDHFVRADGAKAVSPSHRREAAIRTVDCRSKRVVPCTTSIRSGIHHRVEAFAVHKRYRAGDSHGITGHEKDRVVVRIAAETKIGAAVRLVVVGAHQSVESLEGKTSRTRVRLDRVTGRGVVDADHLAGIAIAGVPVDAEPAFVVVDEGHLALHFLRVLVDDDFARDEVAVAVAVADDGRD